jgi:gamma-glutamyl-gamma-aminobutyrate hydrolase PuuD
MEPRRCGGSKQPALKDMDSALDALEPGLLEKAISDGKPFPGICRGCQLLSVGLGGIFYEHTSHDLPGALGPDQPRDRKTSACHELESDWITRCSAQRRLTSSRQ